MTRSQAKLKLWNIIAESGANKPHYSAQPSTVFAKVAAKWQDSYLSRRMPSTRRTMQSHLRKHLLPKFGKMPVDCITADVVNDWLGELRGILPSTMQHIVMTLCLILGIRFGRKKIVYPSRFDPQDEPVCYTPEQMVGIAAGARKQKYRMLFETAAETGMRAGELYALAVGDIDFARCVIHVRRAVWEGRTQSPKSKNAYRVVDVVPSLIEHLREYLAGRTEGLVFQSKKGTALRNTNVVKRTLHPILEKLGIPQGGMHGFRHGRVSFLVQEGCNLELIKRWIGHGSDEMIRRYLHLRPEYGQSQLRQLPEMATYLQSSWPRGPNFQQAN
jgi:integrase